MAKRQYITISRRKKNPVPIILIVCLVFVIIAGGIGGVLYAATSAVGHSIDAKGVTLTATVSGDDVVIQILEAPAYKNIHSLELVMEGYSLPPGLSMQMMPEGDSYPKSVIYENVVAGIYGEIQIMIRAHFEDGSSGSVLIESVRIT